MFDGGVPSGEEETAPDLPREVEWHPFIAHTHDGLTHAHAFGCGVHYGKPSWKCPECQAIERQAALAASPPPPDLDGLQAIEEANLAATLRANAEDHHNRTEDGGLAAQVWSQALGLVESHLTAPTGDPARAFAYWFAERPYYLQRRFVVQWLARRPEDERENAIAASRIAALSPATEEPKP